MDKLKQLIKKMEADMRADLIADGDYDASGENGIDDEGIRIAVYEDLNDSLKYEFSDILYK
jgi:hypothetical protein